MALNSMPWKFKLILLEASAEKMKEMDKEVKELKERRRRRK